MRLYEINTGEYIWYVASSFEGDILSFIREEMDLLEWSDTDIDLAMERPVINELTRWDAEDIIIEEKIHIDLTEEVTTLWDMFRKRPEEGIIYYKDMYEDEPFTLENYTPVE